MDVFIILISVINSTRYMSIKLSCCVLYTHTILYYSLIKLGGKSKEAEFETCSCTLYSGNIQSLFQLKRKVSGFWKDEKPEKTVLKEGVWSGNERSWMNLDERNSRGTWRKRKWEEGREVITLEIRTKIWKDDFWTDLQRKVSKTWKQEKKELRARDDKTKDIYSRGRREETDS